MCFGRLASLYFCCYVCGASLLWPGTAQAQLQTRSPEKQTIGRQVTLDVNVTDRRNEPLTGLHAGDFEIFDQQNLTVIEHFQEVSSNQLTQHEAPQILLVMDAINTPWESLARAKDQVKNFLGRDGGRLAVPVSILILTDTQPRLKGDTNQQSPVMALGDKQAFVRRIPASRDGLSLARSLDQSVISLSRILEAQGGEGESERVSLSIQALNFIATAERKEPGRKIMICISPGWPLLAQSNAKTREQLFDTIIYFSDLLREAKITLNMVDPNGAAVRPTVSGGAPPAYINGSALRGGPTPVPTEPPGATAYMEYLKGVASAKQADGNDLALQVLAHQNGGLVLIENNEIEAQIARCAKEASSYYVLSYAMPPMAMPVYHKLDIRVKKAGAVVNGPTGYYRR